MKNEAVLLLKLQISIYFEMQLKLPIKWLQFLQPVKYIFILNKT